MKNVLPVMRPVLPQLILFSFWFVWSVWEKSLGWPVVTIWGLIMMSRNSDQTRYQMILTGVGSLIVAVWYDWPVVAVILLLILTSYLSRVWRRYPLTILLSWAGALIVHGSQSTPIDATVIGYLLILVLVSIWVTLRSVHWRWRR